MFLNKMVAKDALEKQFSDSKGYANIATPLNINRTLPHTQMQQNYPRLLVQRINLQ